MFERCRTRSLVHVRIRAKRTVTAEETICVALDVEHDGIVGPCARTAMEKWCAGSGPVHMNRRGLTQRKLNRYCTGRDNNRQVKNSLYKSQRLETLVVRVAITCRVHAQAQVFKFQNG
jgi:hypothetical protein